MDEEEDNTFAPKINKLSEIQKEKIKEKRLDLLKKLIIKKKIIIMNRNKNFVIKTLFLFKFNIYYYLLVKTKKIK